LITDPKGERKPLPYIRPKYYSVENTEQATGLTYRYVRDQARLLGVRILKLSGGRRLLIDADDFDQKVAEAQNGEWAATAPETETPEDATAAVLRSLGLEVVK
jgi:hypothetical protein